MLSQHTLHEQTTQKQQNKSHYEEAVSDGVKGKQPRLASFAVHHLPEWGEEISAGWWEIMEHNTWILCLSGLDLHITHEPHMNHHQSWRDPWLADHFNQETSKTCSPAVLEVKIEKHHLRVRPHGYAASPKTIFFILFLKKISLNTPWFSFLLHNDPLKKPWYICQACVPL